MPVLAAAALMVLGCAFQVDETEFVIVSRFGAPRRVIAQAGLQWKFPPPIDTLLRVDRRMHLLDAGSGEFLTSDKKNVLLSSFLTWAVEEPARYLASVADQSGAEARLRDVLHSELGSVVGEHPLSSMLSVEAPRTDLEQLLGLITERVARRAAESFGIRVSAVHVKRINFPAQNKTAVFQRMQAERWRIAMGIRSEGEEEAEKIRAQAKRDGAALVAEARRQAELIRGEADAEATRIYAEAFGKDPQFFEFLRSLQAYEKLLGPSSTVVVPADARILRVLRDPDAFVQAPLFGPQRQGGRP
jgi:membrane protease subunit HflC